MIDSRITIIINAGSGSVDNSELATQIRERFSFRGIEGYFLPAG